MHSKNYLNYMEKCVDCQIQGGRKMNLLIVDDEESAILAVKKGVNWDQLAFNHIYTASNILEAKEQLEVHTVDVLLCDIEMPKGSGLELLAWINVHNPSICTLFMTCHAEFSFVQQAMHLGSFEYILKPLQFDQLEKVIKKAIEKVEKDRHLEEARAYWQKGRQVMEKQFWHELLSGDIATNKALITTYLKRNQINIAYEDPFVVILLNCRGIANKKLKEQKLFEFALRNIIEEIFHKAFERITVEPLNEEEVLVVIGVAEVEDAGRVKTELLMACRALQKSAQAYLQCRIGCYIGKPIIMSKVLGEIEALQHMNANNVVGEQRILFANYEDNLMNKQNHILETLATYESYTHVIKQIRGDIEEKAQRKRAIEADLMSTLFFLLQAFSKDYNIVFKDVFEVEKKYLIEQIDESPSHLLKWLTYIEQIINEYENKRSGKDLSVNKVKAYIKNHLKDEMQVEHIAKHVHLNADYLNRVFKKEVGVSINKYLIDQRIERAKWLLHHTDKQIGEVAVEVGYYNYSSFNRSFSKVVGKSPQEWKCSK